VGIGAKEIFTKRDGTRDVENGIGCQLMQLHTLNKTKKPRKELVGRQR
jgi:hypothetical protein